MSIIILHRTPTVTVTVDGNEVPDVTGCDWTYGFGKVPAQGGFTVTRLPSWIRARQTVTIAAGATDATTFERFSGLVYDFPNYKYAPREVSVDCRGLLIKAERALVGEDTDDPDLPGIDLSNKTQAQQIIAVLDAQGLSGRYNTSLIGGAPGVLGELSADLPENRNPNYWKWNTSGLKFIQDRDVIGLGYRLTEAPLPTVLGGGFGIYRPLISPRPAGASQAVLTQGIDIAEDSSASHNDALDVYNRIVVIGGDFGDGPVKAEAIGPHPSPDPDVALQTAPLYRSPLIETAAFAQQIADWQLQEQDQIILKAELSTPRSDLFRLESSVYVSGTFDRIEIEQALWLRQVSGGVRARQPFRQKLSLRAPAAVGVGGLLLPQETFTPGSLAYGLNWWQMGA